MAKSLVAPPQMLDRSSVLRPKRLEQKGIDAQPFPEPDAAEGTIGRSPGAGCLRYRCGNCSDRRALNHHRCLTGAPIGALGPRTACCDPGLAWGFCGCRDA